MERKIIKFNNKKSISFLKNFFNEKKLSNIIKDYQNVSKIDPNKTTSSIIRPRLQELYFLYNLVKLNKRLTCLEFGSGYSTLLISLALLENAINFKNKKLNIKKSNMFELFTIDNEKKYLQITKNRNSKIFKNFKFKPKINYLFSKCSSELYNGKITHSFDKLPQCIPDFIYLDGPSNKINGSTNNFVFNHPDVPIMSSDILKIEYFLNNQTIIVIDGRHHNVIFLKNNLKRNWIYYYVKFVNKHIFLLDETPTGIISINLTKFYKKY